MAAQPASYRYDDALAFAKQQGYSQKEFDDWYVKNLGAVAAKEGSGGDVGRIAKAFGTPKAGAPQAGAAPRIATASKTPPTASKPAAQPPTSTSRPSPVIPLPTAQAPLPPPLQGLVGAAPEPLGAALTEPAAPGLETTTSADASGGTVPVVSGEADVLAQLISGAGPITLRQGLGQRSMPSLLSPLAGLKRIY